MSISVLDGNAPASALPVPTSLGATSWNKVGFFIYRRRSDPRATGNRSMEMQQENVVDKLEETVGFSLGNCFHKFYEEEISGADADVEMTFGDSGDLSLSKIRPEFQQMLQDVAEWTKRTRGVPVICCFMLNRLGRSKTTSFLIDTLSGQTQERLRVWRSTQHAQFLNPAQLSDKLTIWAEIDLAGKQELDVKREFVTGTKLSLARIDATRSLSERQVGYRRYPCGRDGQELQDLSVIPDHYRIRIDITEKEMAIAAYEAAATGMRPPRIAAMLQARFGPHPLNKRPWTKQVVVWLLHNPLYRGVRRYNRRTAVKAGSKIRPRNEEAKWVHSPYSEDLRIVTDALWFSVQDQMRSWGYGPRLQRADDAEEPKGRITEIEHYFHKSTLLRCGLCGGSMHIKKQRSDSTYAYVCNSMTNRGLPLCQSHDASEVDENVGHMLEKFFENIASYRVSFAAMATDSAKALADLRSKHEVAQQQLAALQAGVVRQIAEASNANISLSPLMLQTLDSGIGYQSAVVKDFENRIAQWGESDRKQPTSEILQLLDHVDAFRSCPFNKRKLITKKLLSGVFIWPDAALFYWWKGDPKDQVDVALDAQGRTLGAARGFTALDTVLLESSLKRLMLEGEIAMERFVGTVSNSILYNWHTKGGAITQSSLLRIYTVALDEWLNAGQLREDVTAYVQAKVDNEGSSWYRLEKDTGLARATLQRIYEGETVEILSFSKAAKTLGTLDRYRELPSWVYLPEHLSQITDMVSNRRRNGKYTPLTAPIEWSDT